MNLQIQRIINEAKDEMNEAIHAAKRHPATLTLIAAGAMFIIGYMCGGKSAVVILDTPKPEPYKPGITRLYHTEFPPFKEYQDPIEADIYCVDGEKLVLFSSFAAVKLDGSCQP